MFQALLKSLFLPSQKEHPRAHDRHEEPCCAIRVNGKLHPVQNWSEGGALVTAPEQHFGLGDDVTCQMQFRVDDTVLDVPVSARIVRKATNGIALQFQSVSNVTQDAFQDVLARSRRVSS